MINKRDVQYAWEQFQDLADTVSTARESAIWAQDVGITCSQPVLTILEQSEEASRHIICTFFAMDGINFDPFKVDDEWKSDRDWGKPIEKRELAEVGSS
jgi:hypothetical protein